MEKSCCHTPVRVSWFSTYKPVLLVFTFITIITLLTNGAGGLMSWMQSFMAAFFLSFSFFKLLDIDAFADSFSSYDPVAAHWKAWGYLYPFVEALLGLACLTGWDPLVTNLAALLVMSVGMTGVLRVLGRKQKIRCACLGTVFNLPMSTITVIENGLMIAMSGISVITLLSKSI